MSGFEFLISLVVIYLIFRSVMRKVLSKVNPEGGGALKGKLGDILEKMKQEMERARLEAEREASGEGGQGPTAEDPWAELTAEGEPFPEEILEGDEATVASRDPWDAEDERPSLHERWDAEDERPSLHERWEAEDERPSLHERWEAGDERPSLRERWEAEEEEVALWDRLEGAEKEGTAAGAAREGGPGSCRHRRRRRMGLKEAIIWKEILDRPLGLR